MLGAVAVIAAVVVVSVLGFAASRPDTLSVQRTITIKAPPDKVFPLIDDLQRWRDWSPYEKKDPAMTRRLSGPPSGPGAAYEWDGNKNIGQGHMRIAETAPPSRVAIELDFIRPFENHCDVLFTLEPEGNATRVTWSLRGAASFTSKLMGLVVDMDRMIGADFESGLANLKALAET